MELSLSLLKKERLANLELTIALTMVGNQPNVWDGVPKEILLKHNLEYDPEWESKFLNIEKRNDIAKWDEKGNLIS